MCLATTELHSQVSKLVLDHGAKAGQEAKRLDSELLTTKLTSPSGWLFPSLSTGFLKEDLRTVTSLQLLTG